MARNLLTPSIILIGLFTFISYLAHLNVFNSFDYNSMVFLQKIIPSFFDIPFALLSFTGSTEVTVLFLVVFGIIFLRTKKRIPYAAIIFGLIFAIEIIGKVYIEQERPPIFLQKTVFPFVLPSAIVPFPYAFPSGHMARICFVSILYLGFFSKILDTKKRKIVSGAIVAYLLIMSISRIYLGAHWFSDVLGGSLLGFSLGFFTNYFFYGNHKSSHS